MVLAETQKHAFDRISFKSYQLLLPHSYLLRFKDEFQLLISVCSRRKNWHTSQTELDQRNIDFRWICLIRNTLLNYFHTWKYAFLPPFTFNYRHISAMSKHMLYKKGSTCHVPLYSGFNSHARTSYIKYNDLYPRN